MFTAKVFTCIFNDFCDHIFSKKKKKFQTLKVHNNKYPVLILNVIVFLFIYIYSFWKIIINCSKFFGDKLGIILNI